MSWLFGNHRLAKSHFYVWYLGSKEADGVRGSAVVLPAMRQLLKESFKKTPSKATVQISSKGLKLIQSVPAMSRNGKVKMQLVKFHIAANCITYSVTGKAPFDDVIGVVMLVLNPEMNCPMHVHCYRCDSPETAQIMHANIQVLLSKPEVQRSIMDLEHRLFLSGLLLPRASTSSNPQSHHRSRSSSATRGQDRRLPNKMATGVVEELKNRLEHTELKVEKMVRAEKAARQQEREKEARKPFRVFGDTLVNSRRSRSLDDLAGEVVSTDIRGEPSHFPRTEMTDPFGQQAYERMNSLDGFWRRRRPSSSFLRI